MTKFQRRTFLGSAAISKQTPKWRNPPPPPGSNRVNLYQRILWFFYACDYALHVVYREAFGSKTTQEEVWELLVQNKHLRCSVLIVSISYLSSTPVKKEEVLELLLRIKLWRSILGQNISSQILGKSFISY